MIVTVLSRLMMCADDLALLDRMAVSAGKSRDVFVSDVLFHMVTIERALSSDELPAVVGE